MRVSDHELDRPRLRRIGTTPNIVDRLVEYLSEMPGAKGPRFITGRGKSCLDVPCRQQGTNRILIPTQHEDIDILMLARLPLQIQIDSPPARDPSRNV